MNKTQQWLNSYYAKLPTIDITEAVSILKDFLQQSIKLYDFDDLEYLLDKIDMDKVPYVCLNTIVKTLRPYCSEFEFWYEFVADVNKRK
jgi:hypothetical protein